MSRKNIPHVTCDTCFVVEPMAGRDDLPDGWAKFREKDVCPSCLYAIDGFLWAKTRTDELHGNGGHPGEREAYERRDEKAPL